MYTSFISAGCKQNNGQTFYQQIHPWDIQRSTSLHQRHWMHTWLLSLVSPSNRVLAQMAWSTGSWVHVLLAAWWSWEQRNGLTGDVTDCHSYHDCFLMVLFAPAVYTMIPSWECKFKFCVLANHGQVRGVIWRDGVERTGHHYLTRYRTKYPIHALSWTFHSPKHSITTEIHTNHTIPCYPTK